MNGKDGIDLMRRGPVRELFKLFSAELFLGPLEGDSCAWMHICGATVDEGVFVIAHQGDFWIEVIDEL